MCDKKGKRYRSPSFYEDTFYYTTMPLKIYLHYEDKKSSGSRARTRSILKECHQIMKQHNNYSEHHKINRN